MATEQEILDELLAKTKCGEITWLAFKRGWTVGYNGCSFGLTVSGRLEVAISHKGALQYAHINDASSLMAIVKERYPLFHVYPLFQDITSDEVLDIALENLRR